MVSYHYFRFYLTFEISIHLKKINQTTNGAGIATRYVKEWKKDARWVFPGLHGYVNSIWFDLILNIAHLDWENVG